MSGPLSTVVILVRSLWRWWGPHRAITLSVLNGTLVYFHLLYTNCWMTLLVDRLLLVKTTKQKLAHVALHRMWRHIEQVTWPEMTSPRAPIPDRKWRHPRAMTSSFRKWRHWLTTSGFSPPSWKMAAIVLVNVSDRQQSRSSRQRQWRRISSGAQRSTFQKYHWALPIFVMTPGKIFSSVH